MSKQHYPHLRIDREGGKRLKEIGVSENSFKARILPLKYFDELSTDRGSELIQAIQYSDKKLSMHAAFDKALWLLKEKGEKAFEYFCNNCEAVKKRGIDEVLQMWEQQDSSNTDIPANDKHHNQEAKTVKDDYKEANADNNANEYNIDIPNLASSADTIKDYFKSDNSYGDSAMSRDMENEDFARIAKMCGLHGLKPTQLLKDVALKMCEEDYREKYEITNDVAIRIFGEASEQLSLIGENITDIVKSYNLS